MVTGIGIVSAETLTGTIGGSNFTQTTITQVSATTTTAYKVNGLYVNTFENTGNLKSIVMWSKNSGTAFSTDVGAPSGSSTPVTIRISNQTLSSVTHTHTKTDGRIVGNGTFGYQKVFTTATPPVEVPSSGYMWLAIDTWDLSTDTGTQWLYFDYDAAAIYNATYGIYGGTSVSIPDGFATFSVSQGTTTLAGDAAGNTQMNLKDNAISASYTVSKPAGVGIMGSIGKSVGGQNFTSQALVYDATGAIVTSESTLTPNTFNFSVTSAQVILGIKDSSGNKYNTSLLFSPAGVTPTPTPTTTPSPNNPIPAGYIRSMFQAVDGVTSGQIHNATINIKDETAGTWFNGSYLGMGSYYGTWYIDTLPGHTLSGYGSADGYTSTSLLNVPADGNKMYELIMQPGSVAPAPTGKVKLFVLVNDFDNGAAVSGAKVTVSMFQESTVIGYTNTAGTATFDVKNVTGYTATAEKNGYYAVTRSGTTTASGPDTIRIELRKPTVTPVVTRTPVAGEVTARPTLDMRTSSEKDNDIMDLIRNNGESLVSLAILMTMIFLVGGIGGRK